MGFCPECGATPRLGAFTVPTRYEKGIGYVYIWPCSTPRCASKVEMDLSAMREAAMAATAAETGLHLQAWGSVANTMKGIMENENADPDTRVRAGAQLKKVIDALTEFSGLKPLKGALPMREAEVIRIVPGGTLDRERAAIIEERKRVEWSTAVQDARAAEAASETPPVPTGVDEIDVP